MGLKKLKEILREHSLKNTSCRVDVLSCFLKAEYAIAPKDLESGLHQYDRVTLYRTLNTFIEKGILHKIPDDNGTVRYGLTPSVLTTEAKREHIHFKCDDCGRTECLSDYHIPQINLPAGYKANQINLVVKGQCQRCNLNYR